MVAINLISKPQIINIMAESEDNLSEANNAQTMGILSVCLLCTFGGVVSLILGYIAYSKGKKAIKEYELNQYRYNLKSYNQAKNAKILGIIGSILGILYIIGLTIYMIFYLMFILMIGAASSM
jgi:uncharacterized membrane protein